MHQQRQLCCTAVIVQIKNSLAKAFSRKKSGSGKSDSAVTVDSDSISIVSDVSVADSAAEYLPSPAVRTAGWFVLCFVESFSMHVRSKLSQICCYTCRLLTGNFYPHLFVQTAVFELY